MASDGPPDEGRNHYYHENKSEPCVYTISGLYSQVPASDDSEVTESTCASTCEFVRASDHHDHHSFAFCPTSDTYGVNDCGICKLRPRCLQRFANIKVFVFLCCILVTLQQTLSSGYLNSVITTIEKRFDITSGLSGAIASTYEIGNLITIIFVSYLGSRRHIPVWLAIGVIIMGIGSMIFVLPQFITERYTVEGQISPNLTQDNICRVPLQDAHNGFLTSPDNGMSRWCNGGHSSNGLAVFIFMFAQLLIGCGGSPLFTLGTTYIDDHVKRESAAMYIGCLYSMVAFGPVCGFLLGGYLLSFYVDGLTYDTEELNINPSDPRWVGAWWGGFLIIGCLLLIFSLPVFAFPKRLRHTRRQVLLLDQKGHPVLSDALPPSSSESVQATQYSVTADDSNNMPTKNAEDNGYGKNIRDIPSSMMRLICNPVYIVTCLGSCMELIIVSGFVVFLPKYLETQFSISKSQANIFTGGIAIPGACVGIFMGGYFLKRFQLRPKGAVQFVLICNLVCMALYGLIFFLGCDNVRMAGATTPYFNSTQSEKFQVNLTAMCNMGCECSPNDIAPICGSNGVTYFSPCHAGCTTRTPRDHHEQEYANCKCITGNQSADNYQEVTIVPVATNGPCMHFCYTIIPFMILLFLMSLVVSITQMPLLMIVLRSVEEHERSFALGMQFVIYRLFGYIPSPIVFGNVIDSTCILWKAHCTNRGGFCLMYDIEKFRYKYVGICAGIKVVAASIFLLDWFLIRQCCERNKDFTLTMRDMMSSVLSLDKICQDETYVVNRTETEGNIDEEQQSVLAPISSKFERSPTPFHRFSPTLETQDIDEKLTEKNISYESSI